jgi:Acetyltransferase (GNAT) domain
MPEKLVACPEGGASVVESVSKFRHGYEGRSQGQLAGLRTLPLNKAVGIHTLNPLEDSRWDDLVARHPRASAFHQRGWLQALARTYGYEPVVLTTSAPTAELKNGLVFCHVKSWLTGRRFVSLPFSDHCEPICDSIEEMNALICCSQAVSHDQHCRYVEVRPTSEDFAQTSAGSAFRPAGSYFLHVMDLRPKLDDLFRSLDKDCVQRRIRRAERAGLVEKSGTSDELLKVFYSLFVITRSRHHLPPPPYAWFQNLVQCQGKDLELRVAYKDGNPIASILTLPFRQTGYFKYGCSDPRFHKFGAIPWLLWRAIAAAKSQGALAFDMGRTQEENAGLLAFKNHWVGRYQRLTYWRYPGTTSLDTPNGWKLKMVKRVFSHVPISLLAASGKLVYRHIG